MSFFSRNGLVMMAALLCVGGFHSEGLAQQPSVKPGEKIAFLGDSITALGVSSPGGYVHLVVAGLAVNDIAVQAIGAGVPGNKSDQMQARLDVDVLGKKPDWMTLSCGVNDVWHGPKGIPLDQFKRNIAEIVDRAHAAGVKVMIFTATMISEDPAALNNQKLAAYNDFLREIAKEKKCVLADLNADMQAMVKSMPGNQGNGRLTVDGVHMNPIGNEMMATGVLKAFGLNSEQIEKAHSAWLDIPQAVEAAGKAKITIRQFNQLSALASKQNLTVPQLLDSEVSKKIEELTKAAEGRK